MVLALVLGGYIAVIQWGPRLNTDFGLVVQVLAQKAVFIGGVPSLVYLSWEAERIAPRTTDILEAV